MILNELDENQTQYPRVNTEILQRKKKKDWSNVSKKIILIILTIIVVVGIWVSLVAVGALIFLLDQEIEPNSAPINTNANTTRTNSSDDLPIVYIYVVQAGNNESRIFKLYEVYRRDLNERKLNFTLPDCVNVSNNCSIEGALIAYLSPLLLNIPKLAAAEKYLLLDFSNVSFSEKENFYKNSVSILNSTTIGKIDNDVTLRDIVFGLRVDCPEGYEFNPSLRFCSPDNFNEDLWHPSGNTGRLIMRIGIVCITVIGLITSFLSLVTLILRQIFEDNAVAGVRQSRIQKFFNTILSPSLLFLFIFGSFCVVLFAIFDLPDPSDTYQKVYNTHSDIILLNLYGALFHFGIFGFFFWVNFTLLNLLLTLFFPFKLRSNANARVSIVLTELVVSVVVPLFLVIATLVTRAGIAYQSVYIWLIVSDNDDTDNIDSSLPSLILYFVPLLLSCLGILTLTPLIASRIKWDFLRSEKLKINNNKLSGLQYRILLYAILMFLLYIALLTGLVLYTMLYQSNTFAIYTVEFKCLTANVPASVYRNDKLQEYSTTMDALKSIFGTSDVISEYERVCHVVDKTNRIHPGWMFIAEAFLIRILIICIFIVTLPSKANYRTWKNIILKVFRCCKKDVRVSSSTL